MHPDAQALIDQRKREARERWEGKRPLFDTAYTKGDFMLAEPGCEVWGWSALTLPEGADPSAVRMRSDGEARGGIILEITTDWDEETGERKRAFRTIDYDPRIPLWQATTVLQEAECDPQTFTNPDWTRIREMYRRLCREVGQQKHIASMAEIDMVTDAFHLASIIGRTLPR
jgi:hypothetical protein